MVVRLMEIVVIGLVTLAIYLFIRSLSRLGVWISSARFGAYRQLAARYHGRYESRGLTDSPTVSFSYNGSQVRVGLAPTIAGNHSQNARTRVVTRFAKAIPFRFELAPVGRPSPHQPPRGTGPVRLDQPGFDGQFLLQANDAEMAREFLAPTVQRSILGLRHLAPPAGMLVSINPERLLIQVDTNLAQHAEALAAAVHHALIIHDGLLEGVHRQWSRGIDIVDRPAEDDDDTDHAPPTCKVCGELITVGPIITCTACKTPHHRDCWEYVGACSIYGCHGGVGLSG
jgi:hypothetical protein